MSTSKMASLAMVAEQQAFQVRVGIRQKCSVLLRKVNGEKIVSDCMLVFMAWLLFHRAYFLLGHVLLT